MIIMGYWQLAEGFNEDIKKFFIRGYLSEILSVEGFVERYFSDMPKDKNLRKEMQFLLTHLEVHYHNLSTKEGLEWLKKNYPIKF